jgi:hypothetical protein
MGIFAVPARIIILDLVTTISTKFADGVNTAELSSPDFPPQFASKLPFSLSQLTFLTSGYFLAKAVLTAAGTYFSFRSCATVL